MNDDPSALLFELARLAQRGSIRRRRRRGATRARQTAPPSPTMPRTVHMSPMQRRGDDYESRALSLLIDAGLHPLARNLRCHGGEIDLVMRDGDTLVIVEVRARACGRYGGAAASVGHAKQSRLAHAAARLLPVMARRHWHGRQPRVRFDVVAFEGDRPVWLRHAFDVA